MYHIRKVLYWMNDSVTQSIHMLPSGPGMRCRSRSLQEALKRAQSVWKSNSMGKTHFKNRTKLFLGHGGGLLWSSLRKAGALSELLTLSSLKNLPGKTKGHLRVSTIFRNDSILKVLYVFFPLSFVDIQPCISLRYTA